MTLAARIKKLLSVKKITYREFPHKSVTSLWQAANILQIDPAKICTAQILTDKIGNLLVVYPLNMQVDILKLNQKLRRNLVLLPAMQTNRLFNDCDAGCWPPIGQAYNLEMIIDKSIQQQNPIFFSAGSYTSLVQMHGTDFMYLNLRARVLDFVTTDNLLNNLDIEPVDPSLDSLILPKLPAIALKILQLSTYGNLSIQELITTDTETHLLGFDTVSHITVGATDGQVLTDFWRHAFYAAAYAERITHLVAIEQQLDPATSYLAGLFHNFGLLFFSQLYPPEYSLLKKWMALNPKVSIAILEHKLLGMGQAFNIARAGHAQLGERLMRHWHMPEAVCVITREHHSLMYQGDYAAYVKIIQIANQLLREDGIGDGSLAGIPEQLLAPLGLTAQQVRDGVQDIQSGLSKLDLYLHNWS